MKKPMPYHEELLGPALRDAQKAGRIVLDPTSDQFFTRLARNFPANGSKIYWSRIPGAIGTVLDEDGISGALGFTSAIRRRHALAGPAEYAGDSLTEFVIRGDLDDLIGLLPKLLEIPQHHYVAAANGTWCFCFSMEGDADFGFAPSQ